MALIQRRRSGVAIFPVAGEPNVVYSYNPRHRGQHEADYLASLLRKYGKSKSLYDVHHVHAHLIACGFESDTFLRNCLIQGYGNCGSVADAQVCFDSLSSNCYSWTLLIKAFAENGFLDDALIVFNRNPFKDVVTWNAMITLLVRHGRSKEALHIFHGMSNEGVKANNVTFLCAVDACTRLESVDEGQKVHSAIIDGGYGKNLAVGSALIDMYGKWGFIHKARSVFDSLPCRDVVLWTAMIATYAGNGDLEEALYLFHHMQFTGIKPDVILYVCLLDMCTTLKALDEGKIIHTSVEENHHSQNVMVATALINLYGKCTSVLEARSVFDGLMHRDIVSFNAMITAFDQNECGEQALSLFYQLYSGRLDPSNVTFVCVLEACSSLAALEAGRVIHASIVFDGFEKDTLIWFALINMYGKSGSVKDAKDLFSRISKPNLITWNAMIALLSHNGESNDALYLFHQMQIEGVKPDDSTFVSILTACSHSGFVEYGYFIFYSIDKEHDVLHTFGHFLSLLDLMNRAGLLCEAECLIYNMPLDIVGVAWRCLLGACIIHGDTERGVWAANYCFTLEPMNAVPYVIMSNLFTSIGRSDGN